jgi:hypothetical protein
MNRDQTLLSFLLLVASAAQSQNAPLTLPAGTQLPLSLPRHLPLKVREPLRAELLYPVYADNTLVLPAKTIVTGTVVSLKPDHHRRLRGRLGADFTPFDIPVVHFNSILLADGTSIPITTGDVTDGAPIFRAVAPPAEKGGFIRRQISSGVDAARSDLAIYIGPDKADRLKVFLWNRLPYHPQRIETGTAWTTEITSPISLQPQTAPALAEVSPAHPRFWEVYTPPPSVATETGPGRWILQAFLDQPLSSEDARTGQPIKAIVAEPVKDPDGTVEIPQGAILTGTVSQAKPARRFNRTGVLSFNFSQLTLPGTETQNVETTLRGADSGAGLALDSEGQVRSKPQDKISLPILFALLAARPLDRDGGRHAAGKDAVGGATLGLAGSVISLAGNAPNVAAGIGYYGAALAFYDRWIARGTKIIFPRDTRIVVETIARRSAPLRPSTPSR